jgi:hypothetical protein
MGRWYRMDPRRAPKISRQFNSGRSLDVIRGKEPAFTLINRWKKVQRRAEKMRKETAGSSDPFSAKGK